MRFNIEPIKSGIDPKAQIKQSGTIECLKEFQELNFYNVLNFFKR